MYWILDVLTIVFGLTAIGLNIWTWRTNRETRRIIAETKRINEEM